MTQQAARYAHTTPVKQLRASDESVSGCVFTVIKASVIEKRTKHSVGSYLVSGSSVT